jgi:large subunit ribosomal protein L10e
MVRKPNRMYRQIRGQVYTRREYMGGVPPCKIAQFCGGTAGKYQYALTLIVEEPCQIRDMAFESARVSATKYLQEKAGMNFFLRIRPYPHAVLREHKQATGAGADRVSSGMRAAFGKAVGQAVRVAPGRKLITIEVNKEHFESAKVAIRKARMKLPTPCKVLVEDREKGKVIAA